MGFRSKEHARKYMREYYSRKPDKRAAHLKLVRDGLARSKAPLVAFFNKWRELGCAVCAEKELCCLVAHHVNGQKNFGISEAIHRGGQRYSVDMLTEELKKCVCLCENCHRKVHAGIIVLRH